MAKDIMMKKSYLVRTNIGTTSQLRREGANHKKRGLSGIFWTWPKAEPEKPTIIAKFTIAVMLNIRS